ncbi:MAG: ATP-binding protein [Chloroflexota bacterium]|nr:ATP-binding protein [Chloroflexota bacterium]
MSVRMHLTLTQTLLLGLVLAAFAVIVYAVISAQETSRLNYELRMQADDLQERALGLRLRAARGRAGELSELPVHIASHDLDPSLPVVLSGETVAPDGSVAAAMTDRVARSRFSAQLVTGAGQVVAHTAGHPPGLVIADEFWDTAMIRGQHTAAVEVDGEVHQVFGTRVEAGRFSDRLLLVVMSPLALVEATLAGWRLTLSLVVAGTVAVSAAIAWFMASRALRPVDRMTRTARAIGEAADFSRRLPEPEREDELGRLAWTFNDMLDQLATAYATQRRFLADASHELRTPLTVIGTNTSALLEGVDRDPVERAETLRAIARESERMARLVADLSILARVDAGQRLTFQRMAFDSVVLDVYQQQRGLNPGTRLALGEWEQVAVEADPDRLKQVVLNLVDNAIRYTPDGGTVTLDLLRRGSEAILRVRDTGIGIPPEHHGRIFERFYRVDQPRGRQAGGTGLGLAIAREVATIHGGRIELSSQVVVGSTFTLTLPVSRLSVVPTTSSLPPSAPPIRSPAPA